MSKELAEIELRYETDRWRYRGEQLWPLLRIYYFYAIRNKLAGGGQLGHENRRRMLFKLRSSLSGILHLFRRSDFLFVSDDSENRLIDGAYQNKTFAGLFRLLPTHKCHYIENPTGCSLKTTHRRYPLRTSSSTLDLFSYLIHFFYRISKLEGEKERQEIRQTYSVSVNENKLVALHFAYRSVFRFVLSLKRPKIIFLTEGYSNFAMALCASAKSLGIPVIEFQHGVINSSHPGYRYYGSQRFEQTLYPDYLFTHGPYVRKELGPYSWIPEGRLFEVGHPYIDSILKKKIGATRSTEQQKSPLALITLQWTDQSLVTHFIGELAQRLPQWEFQLLPRGHYPIELKAYVSSHKNIRIVEKADFYQLIQTCDAHITTYSTTALEAILFRKSNLLLNFDNMSKVYFERLIPESKNQVYTTDLEIAANSLENFVSEHSTLSHDEISENLLTPGFAKNLEKILNEKFHLNLSGGAT